MKEVNTFLASNRNAILILLVVFLGLVLVSMIIGLAFWFKPLWVEPERQAKPPTPSTTYVVISLEPEQGPVGTAVMVRGQGWSAGQTIGFYLTWPARHSSADDTFAYTVADGAGRFSMPLIIPPLSLPVGQDTLVVVAQGQAGGPSANALFRLDLAPEQPTPTSTVTPEQTDYTPQVRALTEVNVRSGPGTTYPIVGLLGTNQTAMIFGISPDRGWWQISFPGANDGRGWIAAEYVTARNTTNIPVVQPIPLPTTATPTQTGTGTPTPTATATATATPTPSPTICPHATPEPLWVDPVLSPTDQLFQTIRVYLGSGELVTVITESGTFTVSGSFDAMNNPALVNMTLLPDTTHSLTVFGQVKASMINGCPFGGYTLSTQVDRYGQPLLIMQQTTN